jgi:hypothetical protein
VTEASVKIATADDGSLGHRAKASLTYGNGIFVGVGFAATEGDAILAAMRAAARDLTENAEYAPEGAFK